MLYIKNQIRFLKYNSLILYALLRCDTFTVRVPKYNEEIISSTDKNGFNRLEFTLETFEPFIIRKYSSNKYFFSESESCSEIYEVCLNNDIFCTLFVDDIYGWKLPEMPEDLCLFSKGVCWLKSNSHQKSCWIYTDHDVEKDILKKVIGLKYYDDGEDTEAPKLDNK